MPRASTRANACNHLWMVYFTTQVMLTRDRWSIVRGVHCGWSKACPRGKCSPAKGDGPIPLSFNTNLLLARCIHGSSTPIVHAGGFGPVPVVMRATASDNSTDLAARPALQQLPPLVLVILLCVLLTEPAAQAAVPTCWQLCRAPVAQVLTRAQQQPHCQCCRESDNQYTWALILLMKPKLSQDKLLPGSPRRGLHNQRSLCHAHVEVGCDALRLCLAHPDLCMQAWAALGHSMHAIPMQVPP